jgi:hypothetical protein
VHCGVHETAVSRVKARRDNQSRLMTNESEAIDHVLGDAKLVLEWNWGSADDDEVMHESDLSNEVTSVLHDVMVGMTTVSQVKPSEPENEKRTGERDSVAREADCKSVVADSVEVVQL